MGSSAVTTLISGLETLLRTPKSVVLFPEPVGPVTMRLEVQRLRDPGCW